jgi:hypothetical protein
MAKRQNFRKRNQISGSQRLSLGIGTVTTKGSLGRFVVRKIRYISIMVFTQLYAFVRTQLLELGLELRTYTLSHSTSPFLWWVSLS